MYYVLSITITKCQLQLDKLLIQNYCGSEKNRFLRRERWKTQINLQNRIAYDLGVLEHILHPWR